MKLGTDCNHSATLSHLDFIRWVRSNWPYILRVLFLLLSQQTPRMSRDRGTRVRMGSRGCQERCFLVRYYIQIFPFLATVSQVVRVRWSPEPDSWRLSSGVKLKLCFPPFSGQSWWQKLSSAEVKR